MNYNTVYVGMDVHKETFSLCCYTNEKEEARISYKKLMVITAKSSTISRPCVSITGTMPCSYAVMKLDALASLFIIS